MTEERNKSYAALEEELAERSRTDELTRRQIALLQAIIRIFRETPGCETEEEVAQICLKVAEELTGSAYGFIGELNPAGFFDTTTLSEAGWNACKVPRPQAELLLKNMPNRGINRIGLREHRSWIINDPAAHPEAVDKPPGHPPITSFLGVPLPLLGRNAQNVVPRQAAMLRMMPARSRRIPCIAKRSCQPTDSGLAARLHPEICQSRSQPASGPVLVLASRGQGFDTAAGDASCLLNTFFISNLAAPRQMAILDGRRNVDGGRL